MRGILTETAALNRANHAATHLPIPALRLSKRTTETNIAEFRDMMEFATRKVASAEEVLLHIPDGEEYEQMRVRIRDILSAAYVEESTAKSALERNESTLVSIDTAINGAEAANHVFSLRYKRLHEIITKVRLQPMLSPYLPSQHDQDVGAPPNGFSRNNSGFYMVTIGIIAIL